MENFSNTNFSGNVADLLSAADFHTQELSSTSISWWVTVWGGLRLFMPSGDIFECKAVVTIGSPANADHLLHLFKQHVVNIEKNGAALVNIAGRDFDVQKQFIEDLKAT